MISHLTMAMVDKIIFPSESAVLSMEGENRFGQNVVIPKDSESHVPDKPVDFNIKADEVARHTTNAAALT